MTNGEDTAYPTNIIDPNNRFEPSFYIGLTKREYFAAMALTGIMGRAGDWNNVSNFDFIGKQAVMAADKLIAELNKTKPEKK